MNTPRATLELLFILQTASTDHCSIIANNDSSIIITKFSYVAAFSNFAGI